MRENLLLTENMQTAVAVIPFGSGEELRSRLIT
jgi:hypothetical protein